MALSDWYKNKTLIREINRVEHIISTNIIDCNKVNDVIKNELKFVSLRCLASSSVKEPQSVVTIILRGGKILEIT